MVMLGNIVVLNLLQHPRQPNRQADYK